MRTFLALLILMVAVAPYHASAQPRLSTAQPACPVPLGTGQTGFTGGAQSPPTNSTADLINHFVAASANNEDVSNYLHTPMSDIDLESCKYTIRKLSELANCSIQQPHQFTDGKIVLTWECSGWIDYQMWFSLNFDGDKISKIYGSARTPAPAIMPIAEKADCDVRFSKIPDRISSYLSDRGWTSTQRDTQSPASELIYLEKDQVKIRVVYDGAGMCDRVRITASRDGKPVLNPDAAPELKSFLNSMLLEIMK